MILARQHEKVANRRQDYLHKISTKIVRENQAIVVEDLNTKGMMKNHRLSKAIGACGWSTFFKMLEYKCERQGKTFIRIEEEMERERRRKRKRMMEDEDDFTRPENRYDRYDRYDDEPEMRRGRRRRRM